MSRLSKETVERFFDNHLHIESRTIYIGDGKDDEIDGEIARDTIKAIHLLCKEEKPIKILLNSVGGSFYDGMAIYDMIANCGCHVDIYVLGSAMSIGSIILQAGDTRYAYPNSVIMIHDGQETLDSTTQTVINWAKFAETTRAWMYKIYANRSGKPVNFWKKKCSSDFILTAHEAKSLGLIDHIVGEDDGV